jgi:NUMOD4 motif.
MLEELWVPVEGFPNYVISNYGRIVNINTDKELNPYHRDNGYTQIGLYNDGQREFFYLHRLVAQAFFLAYSEEYNVTLINGIYSDCTVANISIDVQHRRRGPNG